MENNSGVIEYLRDGKKGEIIFVAKSPDMLSMILINHRADLAASGGMITKVTLCFHDRTYEYAYCDGIVVGCQIVG